MKGKVLNQEGSWNKILDFLIELHNFTYLFLHLFLSRILIS